MSNITKIKISGTSYDIKDENACKVVELTQAQYDALPVSAKTSNSLFVITDATAGDLSNYYTKSETSGATEISTALASKADTATTYTKTEVDNAITAATSTKQDTLVSGTNIKTINNQSILGEGNITIEGGGGGGSITIDPTLDSGSTNAVANSAITNAINTLASDKFDFVGIAGYTNYNELYFGANNVQKGRVFFSKVNGNSIVSASPSQMDNLQLVETSSITTSISSSSTDTQVPSAKAVYDAIQGGGGGSSYTAGDGIDITNDVISVTGKVDTSTYETYTAATATAIASKQTTLTAGTGISIVDNVISATGGGGGMTEDDELLLSTALTDLNDRKIDASEVKSNYQKKGDYVTTSTLNTRLAEYETALDEQNVEEVTAYALNDLNTRFGGLKLTKITESEYAALATKDENTLYIVVADPQTR